MRFASQGWPFVLPWLGLGLLLLAGGHPRWAAVSLALGVATLLFFRDPERSFSGPDASLIAPADGKILQIDVVEPEFAGGRRMTRIITFLSVFDVHVQRAPVAGEVVLTKFSPGAKVAAYRANAGEVNEQRLTVLETATGEQIGVIQIAGLVARRVVGFLDEGEVAARGDRLGLIKFGSRVDLLMPHGYIIEVRPGDRVRAGETVMATPGSDPIVDGTDP